MGSPVRIRSLESVRDKHGGFPERNYKMNKTLKEILEPSITDEQKIEIFDILWPSIKEEILLKVDSIYRQEMASWSRNGVQDALKLKFRKLASEIFEEKKNEAQERIVSILETFLSDADKTVENMIVGHGWTLRKEFASSLREIIVKKADDVYQKISGSSW